MVFAKVIHSMTVNLLKCDFWRKRKVKTFLLSHETIKLQLGSGKNFLEGWLNTEKSVSLCLKGAVYMDVSQKFALPDDSVDYVFSEHLFEHLTLSQARNMLKESFRVMKSGGIIRLATPDIEFLLDLYQHPDKEINQRYMKWAAKDGHIPAMPVYVINRFHTAWGHQIIYDYDTLAALLTESGFKDVCRCEMSKSCHPELCDTEGHFHVMPYDFACLETMILEAKK